jgi:hypothetical protein
MCLNAQISKICYTIYTIKKVSGRNMCSIDYNTLNGFLKPTIDPTFLDRHLKFFSWLT